MLTCKHAPWVSLKKSSERTYGYWLLKFESVCYWKLKIFFFARKCMLEYIIRQYQSFLSKLVYKLKVKVDWKNSRITWGVLGLTSWVCLKASKVYPGIHNRIPTRALAGARSYWKHWWMSAFIMVFCGITCTVPSE